MLDSQEILQNRMNKNTIIDISKSYEDICKIENMRAPKLISDHLIIFIFSIVIVIFRLLLWVWQCIFLRLKKPKKNLKYQNIVIYLHGMLGDVSVHVPALKLIRDSFKESKITCVCNAEGFPIRDYIVSLQLFDDCFVIDSQPVVRSGFDFIIAHPKLKTIKADLFVNFSPFTNQGIPGFVAREMMFAKKIGATFYAGDSLNFFGSSRWSKRMLRFFIKNEPRRGVRVLKSVGLCYDFLIDEMPPLGGLPLKFMSFDTSGFLNRYAVINPGAKFTVKRWPAQYFGAVAKYLQKNCGLKVYITGSASEIALAEEVIKFSNNSCTSLCGKTTIAEMIEVIRGASLVVTNDTGPMHLAGLMNRPTIAIFGTRISLKNWYPKGNLVTVLAHYHEDSFSFDDIGNSPHRMDKIPIELVISEINKLIEHAKFIDNKTTLKSLSSC